MAKQSAAQKPSVEKVEGAAASKTRAAEAAINRPAKVDRLIHERVRLAIVSALAANPSLTFSDLKKLLNTSDGNVSVHARKLEEAEYITSTKSFEGRVPRTEYRLTASGRRAFEKYLNHMEALIHAMREK